MSQHNLNGKEYRCTNCNKKLFECNSGFTDLTIKCNRCKFVNRLSATSTSFVNIENERPRVSNSNSTRGVNRVK